MSKLVHTRNAAQDLVTVHITVRDGSHARACRPGANAMLDHRVGTWHVAVTCGNCLRVVAAAEREAYRIAEAIAAGQADAERHVTFNATTGAFSPREWQSAAYLRKMLPSRCRTLVEQINHGNTDAVNLAAYSLHRGELELAHLEQLAAQAELEAYEQRDLTTRGLRMLETLETINEGLRKAGRHATVAEKMAAFVELEHGEALEEHHARFPLDTCECGSGLPSWECELLTTHTA